MSRSVRVREVEASDQPDFDEAEEIFCELLRQEDLEQPDEVRRCTDPAEIVFIWHELKRMVVLELEERESEVLFEPTDFCYIDRSGAPPA